MPVVELNINRIRKLVSGNVTRKQILDVLPFLGLDIESEDGDKIRIEYSPNRPDYSTEFGIIKLQTKFENSIYSKLLLCL